MASQYGQVPAGAMPSIPSGVLLLAGPGALGLEGIGLREPLMSAAPLGGAAAAAGGAAGGGGAGALSTLDVQVRVTLCYHTGLARQMCTCTYRYTQLRRALSGCMYTKCAHKHQAMIQSCTQNAQGVPATAGGSGGVDKRQGAGASTRAPLATSNGPSNGVRIVTDGSGVGITGSAAVGLGGGGSGGLNNRGAGAVSASPSRTKPGRAQALYRGGYNN